MTSVRVIALVGISCAGKSSLCALLPEDRFVILHQDDYFLPKERQDHINCRGHWYTNWERLESMDVKAFVAGFEEAKELARAQGKILVVEGHALAELLVGAEFIVLNIWFSELVRRRRERGDPLRTADYPYLEHVWQENMRRAILIPEDTIVFDGLARSEKLAKMLLLYVEGDLVNPRRMSTVTYRHPLATLPKQGRFFNANEITLRYMFVSFAAADAFAFAGGVGQVPRTPEGVGVTGQCSWVTESLSWALSAAKGQSQLEPIGPTLCTVRAPAFVSCKTLSDAFKRQESDARILGCSDEDLICARIVLSVLWERVVEKRLLTVEGFHMCMHRMDSKMLVIPSFFSARRPIQPAVSILRGFADTLYQLWSCPQVPFLTQLTFLTHEPCESKQLMIAKTALSAALYGCHTSNNQDLGVLHARHDYSSIPFKGCMTVEEMLNAL